VADRPASTPGAALSFREWEDDEYPTLYCYAIARNLKEGTKVKLSVEPRGGETGTLWEKEFKVTKEGGALKLE